MREFLRFWISRYFQRFRRVSSPRIGFPASSGRHVFYSVFEFVFIFCTGLCPCICMWSCAQDCTCTMPVKNVCTSVVSFLYKCHACDVVYYCFIICVCSVRTLLQVLYPTFRLRLAFGLSIPNLRVAFSLRALMLRLVGESSAQRFPTNSARV